MKIAIIHNLPGGGGIRMLNSIIDRYKYNSEIDVYVLGETKPSKIRGITTYFFELNPWKGFIFYNLWIIYILPLIHKRISRNNDWSKYEIIFFSHDYFTKSPYLLRYISSNNKYYLCQEPQREFYEPSKYHDRTIKDKLIKYLRYPIKWIDENNVKYSNKIFCNSLYSQKTLKKIYKRDPEIVYPGVDVNFFTPSKKKKENIIICVGGINITKNQKFVANALTPILDDYKLIFIGDGKKYYKDKIQKINKNIEIISNVSDYELRDFYRRAKLTCIAAYLEPFGLSSIESQSCGTPVLTVEDGGSVETVINGKTGFVTRLDYTEFLTKAKEIIETTSIMGKESRKNAVENWTVSKTLVPLYKYFIR